MWWFNWIHFWIRESSCIFINFYYWFVQDSFAKSKSFGLVWSCLISPSIILLYIYSSYNFLDGVRHVKSVLLAVFTKIPSQEVFLTTTYKSFAPKFVATALFFTTKFPECASEFAPITRICNAFINHNNEKDSSEV